jgi:phage I-like protein
MAQSRAMNGYPPHHNPERDSAVDVHSTKLNPGTTGSAAPAEWIQLIPCGEFNGRDGRGPFRLRNPKLVIGATAALGMEAGIPIDHATDFAAPQGLPAPAAGWIKQLEVRDGAIWGRVEWTPQGASAITTGQYRYISPVFEYSPKGEVIRLLRAGLTNNPNLYLTAISACGALSAALPQRSGEGKSPSDRGEDYEMEQFLAQLREVLGLDDDATAEDVLEQIRNPAGAASPAREDSPEARNGDDDSDSATLRAAGASVQAPAPDPARYVAVGQFQKALTELNTLKAERARERAEHAVSEAIRSGRLIPAQREWAIAYCQADYDGFAAFVAKQPAMLKVSGARDETFDDDARGLVERSRRGALDRTELAICSQLGIGPDEFLKRKRGPQDDFLKLNRRSSEAGL